MRLHSFPPSLGPIVFHSPCLPMFLEGLELFLCFSSSVPENLGGFLLHLIHIFIHKYAVFHALLFPV
jgi:hypothetical protein